jgi:hypothetical protein
MSSYCVKLKHLRIGAGLDILTPILKQKTQSDLSLYGVLFFNVVRY